MISWFEKHSKISLFITLIIAAAIYYISTLTFQPGAPGTSIRAIVYHIGAFFFFSLFLSITIIKGKYKIYLPITIMMAVLYGISDELHQFFVPGRSSSFNDVILDSIGITFASMFYFITIKYKELRISKKNN